MSEHTAPRVSVEIRWADETERTAAKAAVDAAGGEDLHEFNGLFEVRVPETGLEVLKRAKLSFTLPHGLPPAVGGLESMAFQAISDPDDAPSNWDLKLADERDYGTVPAPADRREKDAYLVQVTGSLRPEWQEALAAIAPVHPHAPPDTVRMVLRAEDVDRIRELAFVSHVHRYGLLDTLTPSMATFLREATKDPDRLATFDVTLHEPDGADRVVALLAGAPAAKLVARGGWALRFKAPAGAQIVPAVAELPEVKTITRYTPPTLQLDAAVKLIGADVVGLPSPGGPSQAWLGTGEVVAVFDSGIDPTHPDLADALVSPPVAYGDGVAIDVHGHGTHVAGIIAGRGAVSNRAIRGVAPGATLFSVGIRKASGELDIPPDLTTLLSLAVAAGAKIINLSWRAKLDPDYDQYGQSIDRFARENPDVLVVVAAGNDGAAETEPPNRGRHRKATIGAPAVGKNVLTVGACLNERPNYPGTWGGAPGAAFLFPPSASERIAGPPQFPAALSSRGPTTFSSVKPDLLAPGTMILSTRAAGALPIFTPFGAPPPQYGYMSGTSMAAPFVSGSAAVVREYLRVVRATPAPSAALVKALLILATVPIPGANQNSVLNMPNVGYPDFDQGFGMLDLRAILPHPAAPPAREVSFADVPNTAPGALQARQPPNSPRRSFQSYAVTVPAEAVGPLRVVLVWTDPPGRGVQNRMSLRVRKPDQTSVFGNETHPFYADPADIAAGAQVLDKNNNVLVAVFPTPSPGVYMLTVTAESTAVPYQGYALAVVGPVGTAALTPQFP